MPVKIARSTARPSFGLPELLVTIHTSRQSCSKAEKARIFALVWESSGESRVNQVPAFLGTVIRVKPHNGAPAGYVESFISVKRPLGPENAGR
jgi:hypothetical protein